MIELLHYLSFRVELSQLEFLIEVYMCRCDVHKCNCLQTLIQKQLCKLGEKTLPERTVADLVPYHGVIDIGVKLLPVKRLQFHLTRRS